MSNYKNIPLSGWGRFPSEECRVSRAEKYADLRPFAPLIARGQGRSYGDASLNSGSTVLLTERINRLLAFDDKTGVVRAEAGLTLADLIAVALPRGWFPQVVPGTQFASLGGCVAADVHGKNHHVCGSFASSLRKIELIDGSGDRLSCGPDNEADAFWATVGGMGLTGIVGEVELQLRPIPSAYMQVRHTGCQEIGKLLHALEEDKQEYSVAWIDCSVRGAQLGRGVVISGTHASEELLPAKLRRAPYVKSKGALSLPFDLPGWALSRPLVRTFNEIYFRHQSSRGEFLSHLEPFFFPLDAIHHWNRLYGRRGFLQYQCALPRSTSFEVLPRLLERIADYGHVSFLAVLKRLGPGNPAPLSFPIEGYTLALDFPFAEPLLPLLEALDGMVESAGGRVYLAKDARLSPQSLRRMYPRLGEWLEIKGRLDPQGRFTSSLGKRLHLAGGVA